MAADPDFLNFLKEQLAGFGPVSVRRMFGGAGLYHDGLMFGLVADGMLHFKADGETRPIFEREGSSPFAYMAKGQRRMITSYWRAPEACLDDPDEMTRWARLAFGAAMRSKKP